MSEVAYKNSTGTDSSVETSSDLETSQDNSLEVTSKTSSDAGSKSVSRYPSVEWLVRIALSLNGSRDSDLSSNGKASGCNKVGHNTPELNKERLVSEVTYKNSTGIESSGYENTSTVPDNFVLGS